MGEDIVESVGGVWVCAWDGAEDIDDLDLLWDSAAVGFNGVGVEGDEWCGGVWAVVSFDGFFECLLDPAPCGTDASGVGDRV